MENTNDSRQAGKERVFVRCSFLQFGRPLVRSTDSGQSSSKITDGFLQFGCSLAQLAKQRKSMKEQAFDLGQSYDEFLDKMVAHIKDPVERRIEKTRIAIREIKLSCEDKCSKAKTQNYDDYCQCLKKLPDPDYCHLLELTGDVPSHKSKYIFRSVPGLLDIQVVFHGHAGQVELEFLFKKSGEKISFSRYDRLPDEILKQLPPRKWKIVIDRHREPNAYQKSRDISHKWFHYNKHHDGRFAILIGSVSVGENEPILVCDIDPPPSLANNRVKDISKTFGIRYVNELPENDNTCQ